MFNNLIKCLSFERVEFALVQPGDGGGSRGVVQEGQFSETLPLGVGLDLLSLLGAGQLSGFDHVEKIAVVALFDDGLAVFEIFDLES